MPILLRTALAALAALAGLVLVTDAAITESSPLRGATNRSAQSYDEELAEIDAEIVVFGRRASSRPGSWISLEDLAGLQMERARLTGDYDDFARTESSLVRAFDVATPGSGPFLSRARLNASLHRFDRVETDLSAAEQAAIVSEATRQAIDAARADLAFQLGRYDDALAGFERGLERGRESSALSRLAVYHWKTGAFDLADTLLAEATQRYTGLRSWTRSWFYLLRGLLALDRGRYEQALSRYREADEALPGWWLVEEHIAEVLNLMGQTQEAAARYGAIVTRTGNPEFMDALAEMAGARGDTATAREWCARARAVYEAQLARYPEAAAGHALEHFLEMELDATRAVTLAERNRDLRPGADAWVLLARAYEKSERTADAREAIERALATPWTSADLHATAARIFSRVGNAARADEERRRALAINPHAVD